MLGCKEVKQLVTEKKLQVWNEVVDKANSDYEGNTRVLGICW